MMNSLFRIVCLSTFVALATVACGDDEDKDDGVSVDTPGADVSVEADALQPAAGSAATAPAQPQRAE